MQHICFYTFITNIYLVLTDQLIIIIYTIFKLWESWGFLENWTFFDDVISGQDDVTTVRFWMEVEILGWSFEQKNFGWIGPTSCLLNLWLDTLLFRFQPLKNPHFKKKSTNQTSFPTKSTTLNPMVKSDLVTSSDGTIRFLFFSVAIIKKASICIE